MFNCLTQDQNVYGIDEHALGATLERFIESEREMGKCPHSVARFPRTPSRRRTGRYAGAT